MRADQTDVEEIMELDSGFNAIPFITIANSVVNDVCLDSGYSDAKLKLIETWLAAHFVTVRTKIVESEKVDVISQKFKLTTDLGFHASHYGQTAMAIDIDKNLAVLNKQLIDGKDTGVSIGWLGMEDYGE